MHVSSEKDPVEIKDKDIVLSIRGFSYIVNSSMQKELSPSGLRSYF